ncbi:hypothetical protein ACFVSS_25230 [Peribacillus butanolivorans]|uniref:hypothetical protein n=1 Tax=Peribacillus butanolivorans TaxID=421767 RepID=UPI0036DDDCE1
MEEKRNHKLYYTWNGMMYRCYKKYHSHYKYYGARGVTVDERWHDFWNFVEDVENHLFNGHLLYEKGYQLDKDIKGGKVYSLENCVVALKEENEERSRQKQQKKVLAFNETRNIEFESLAKASLQLGIKRSTMISCLRRGNRHSSGYYFKYIN